MSEHGSLQFVWDIMLQSEWWKQYREMVERSLVEQAGGVSSGGYGFDAGSWSGSWSVFSSGAFMSSGAGPRAAAGSWAAAGAEIWWASSSGSWWMEIPEAWWSSFSGSWWSSAVDSGVFAGSGVFGSGWALGYGLQLI